MRYLKLLYQFNAKVQYNVKIIRTINEKKIRRNRFLSERACQKRRSPGRIRIAYLLHAGQMTCGCGIKFDPCSNNTRYNLDIKILLNFDNIFIFKTVNYC